MPFNLEEALPLIVPRAIAWAERVAHSVSETGFKLDEYGLRIARAVGVQQPELIRVRKVQQLPTPDDPMLAEAAHATGLLGPNMVGLTLGHAILIAERYINDVRLFSHECRHVYQYEQAGSIAAFLPAYLQQVATHTYENAPYEIDARAHEIRSEQDLSST